MKRSTNQQLPIRRSPVSGTARVPDANVLDLRVPTPREVPPDPPRAIEHVRATARNVYAQSAKFLLIALLLSLPVVAFSLWQRFQSVQGKVLGVSTEAYDALRSAGDAIAKVDTALADEEFAKAASSFREARQTLEQFRFVINGATEVFPAISKAKSARAALAAGEELARAGEAFTSITTPLLKPSEGQPLALPDLLLLAHTNLPPALDHIERAIRDLRDVKVRDLPPKLRPAFANLQTQLPQLTVGLKRFRSASEAAYALLGGARTQRYLLLFQDNLELRATGGFVGSVALVDVAGGHVQQLSVPSGGSYDYQGQLKEKVIAPEPLHLVNAHWQLQDANWWPDFPASAAKMMWFYEKSGGPTVDGVIALTPDLLIALLQQTGPIDLTQKYGKVITAESVLEDTLLAVEENPQHPKQIIADLVPLVLDRLLSTSSGDQLAVLAVLERALIEKQLLLYFPDEQREQTMRDLGWAGAYTTSSKDVLSVVDANIGGGKTDGVIDELIQHRATIAKDGSVEVTVSVTRTHHGEATDKFTGVRNIDFVRFYVPEGSSFVRAEGFERIDPKRFMTPEPGYRTDPDIERIEGRPVVDELSQTRTSHEFGFTVFANWMGVGPGESATASITYTLPFRLRIGRTFFRTATDDYSLLVIKQPGTKGRFFSSTVAFPEQDAVRWQAATGAATTQTAGSVQFSAALDTDQFYGVVLAPKQ